MSQDANTQLKHLVSQYESLCAINVMKDVDDLKQYCESFIKVADELAPLVKKLDYSESKLKQMFCRRMCCAENLRQLSERKKEDKIACVITKGKNHPKIEAVD